MFEIKITGFTTKSQAEEFINWYGGQGEQDAPIWLSERKREGMIDVENMNVDIKKTYPLKWKDNVVEMVVNPQ